MKRAVERVDGTLEELDIDSDDALTRDYALRIPVLIAPGGQVLAEGRIEAKPLRRALRNLAT